MPFLENVTRGRGVPAARLAAVAEHYHAFGGRSPINDECRRLLAALGREIDGRGLGLALYWGNRNWKPLLADTMAEMARNGVRRAIAIATSAFSSYSACRQYLEDVENARAAVGAAAPDVEKMPPYWNLPGFLEAMADSVRSTIGEFGAAGDAPPHLVFTAHSIPAAMAATCDYERELAEASRLVAALAAPAASWELAFQSRSGPPSQPWLEPDVCDRIRALAAGGVRRVVLVPIGFVSDHMEVIYDLDTDARAVADAAGVAVARARTVGAAPRFVASLVDAIEDRMAGREPRVLGSFPARPWPCADGCCAYAPARGSGGRTGVRSDQ